jgi:hypothetical protein
MIETNIHWARVIKELFSISSYRRRCLSVWWRNNSFFVYMGTFIVLMFGFLIITSIYQAKEEKIKEQLNRENIELALNTKRYREERIRQTERRRVIAEYNINKDHPNELEKIGDTLDLMTLQLADMRKTLKEISYDE